MSHEHPEQSPHQGEENRQPNEEELRARLEEELRRITVRDVLLQTVISLLNLGGRRLGLGESEGEDRDLAQVRMAIEAVRALLPVLEQENPEQVKPLRDALSQLQMAYAREAGAAAPAARGEPGSGGEPGAGGGPQPRERPRTGGPGGLWVPPGSTS